jgi:chromosome segregation ATPase
MDYVSIITDCKNSVLNIDKALDKYKSELDGSKINRQRVNGKIAHFESIRRELLHTINELESRLNR